VRIPFPYPSKTQALTTSSSAIIHSYFPTGIAGVKPAAVTYLATALQSLVNNPTFSSANSVLATAIPSGEPTNEPAAQFTTKPWYTSLPNDVKSAITAEASALASIVTEAAKINDATASLYIGLPGAVVVVLSLLATMAVL
jgi:hypothetical protein